MEIMKYIPFVLIGIVIAKVLELTLNYAFFGGNLIAEATMTTVAFGVIVILIATGIGSVLVALTVPLFIIVVPILYYFFKEVYNTIFVYGGLNSTSIYALLIEPLGVGIVSGLIAYILYRKFGGKNG